MIAALSKLAIRLFIQVLPGRVEDIAVAYIILYIRIKINKPQVRNYEYQSNTSLLVLARNLGG